MIGGTAGEVVSSKSERFAAGDRVVGMGGWQEYSVIDVNVPGVLRKVDTNRIPLSAYLGAVGMPGVTAWYGLMKIIAPKPGNTVVVSAASGAVGSAVGQLAKVHGARAVGIAGGPDKCRYVRDEQLISLEEAIRRLTSLPADTLKLERRGKLAPGYYADVVVFDPARIRDRATYAKPHQYSTGVRHVLVNGTPVLRNGRHTGATPGRVVRGPGWKPEDQTRAHP